MNCYYTKANLFKYLGGTFLLVLLSSIQIFAQDLIVKGAVIDEEQAPLIGAYVIVKGTTIGTVTDFNGKFELKVPSKESVLEITSIGYATQTLNVGDRTTFNITMLYDTEALEEVVVIGYGEQSKREVTGSIAQVKAEDLDRLATSDIGTALQGQMAGVSVRSAGGSPGANSTITIRGVTSFQDGGSEPLYVVDGVTYTSNPNISPQEIESLEVLKDGASAAIYGSRASAGVILITTKRGKAGQMKVNIDSYYGVQKITSGVNLANTNEHLYINKLSNLLKETGKFNPLEQNKNGLYYDTDWMNELQNDMAPMQNHSLRISGGTSNLTYNITGTIFDQQGVLVGSDYARQTVRANTTYKKGKLQFQVNMGLNNSMANKEPWGLQYDAIKQAPILRGVDSGETDVVVPGANPENMGRFIGKLNQVNEQAISGYNGNARINYELFKGFKLNANIGGSVSYNNQKLFEPSYSIRDEDGLLLVNASNPVAQLRYTDYKYTRTIQEYTATYNRKFGKHKVGFVGGVTFETSVGSRHFVQARDFPSNDTQSIGAANELIAADERYSENKNIGMLGRVQYAYDNRYLFSASIRRDGSSRFHESNRWGVFPSVSAGWNVSEEKFWEPIKPYVSALKIRYGYGETGSDKAGQGLNNLMADLPYQSIVTPQVDYALGREGSDNLQFGAIAPTFVDRAIRWETNVSQNIGVDSEFFEGRFTLSVDVYKNDKRDMLLAVQIPPSTGATSTNSYDRVWQNVGNLSNEGIEIALGYNDRFGDVKFSVNGTFTRNINKVISLAPSVESISGGKPIIGRDSEPTTFLRPGYTAGAFFLIPTDGTIQTAEELAAYQEMIPSAQLGDLKYIDTNGDGVLDQEDRQYMGSGTPEWEAGLNLNVAYKGFDLGVQLFASMGAKVYNGARAYSYLTKRNGELVNAWSPSNPTSNIPMPRDQIEHYNTRTFSDYFIEDGSYLRIQNISLGYTLPKAVVSRMKMNNLRFYVSAQNPFTFTDYSGFDPEVGSQSIFLRGVDRANYPISAVYRGGFSLEF
ncbi:TonB-dependent receptor [Flammeovirga sp. EKP202]|uniref:SusC/RagA family TonB-linked outer membrane protein n=1 Tax=Flammeovirga sp. EKP202 TaxID=2770592 RepID=UPI00165F8FAB|nr:TonB-dependent receptor [Flammeovirga sp. EKP202]MBD0401814.1 TonB-dependent receptor [Flammeovirga sp. EKP202]